MKNKLAILLLLLGLCLPVRAQVFILNDNMLAERLANVKAAVVDSLSGEPVPFASVYVIPSKDTTITNFTLSDAKGEALLDEVPFGSYTFHVEMMGYRPFVKERYFRESEVDMGTIRLQQDEHFLQAATITDVGNPMVIKQDTVEFNASSFRVGANDMLRDLIKRMPGMEITEDGKVKFNGQAIDKLTVGGRTFFFNDQSAALNNLPAAIVDKRRVIDRESEATRATGIDDGTREKVLDVALKKEYEQGWFGNISLKGGVETEGGDDPLRDDRGLLYSANALVSGYTEKDQVTFIANQQNVDDSDIVFVVVRSDGSRTSSLDQGLSTATQLGVNANTSRIKDVETTVSSSFKSTDTDSGTRSSRTTHQEGGDLLSNSEDSGNKLSREFTTNLEFEKENGKVWFHVRPSFSYSDHVSDEANSSETFRLGGLVNEASSTNHSTGHYRYTGLDTDISFRDIGDKKGRMVRLMLEGSYSVSDGDDLQVSILNTAGGAADSGEDGSASADDGEEEATEAAAEIDAVEIDLQLAGRLPDNVHQKLSDEAEIFRIANAGSRHHVRSKTLDSSLLCHAVGIHHLIGMHAELRIGTGIADERTHLAFAVAGVHAEGQKLRLAILEDAREQARVIQVEDHAGIESLPDIVV